MPGESGFVTLEFDPKNRNKIFRKTVRVVTNAVQREVILRVNGFIVPDPNVLRKRIGDLRLNRAEMTFGNVYDTETKYDSILVRNDGKNALQLKFDLSEMSLNFDFYMDKSEIAPGETALVKASFTGDINGKYGFSRFRIMFEDVGISKRTKGQFLMSYTQVEDFKSWTNKQKANSPRVKFFNKTVKFVRDVQDKQVECEYRFENTGKSVLKIRNIRVPNHVKTLSYDDNIEPGERGNIILSVDTSNMSGDLIRYVTVTTNCLSSANVRLTVEGKVE